MSHGPEPFQAFVAREVLPHAAQWDREQALPRAVIARLGQEGYLGAGVPREYGGRGWDAATVGALHEAVGRGSSALANVLTVQAMVCVSLLKWATAQQKRAWLPALARGEIIGAFALTEPQAGSDLQGLATEFTERAGMLAVNGVKRWISCGQFAGVFLVFGRLDGRPAACLVPRETPGLRVAPISELMGFRAAGLAELRFEGARVPAANFIGRPGFALSHVAALGLHHGRLSTACSALGLLRACLEESAVHAAARCIGGRRAGELGMIRALLARMGTDLEATRLLCRGACHAEDERLPEAFEKTLMAKYFASRAAVRAAGDAVQIHGAAGCHASAPVSRYYRDAKIMEIIEGTTQVHEDLLGGMLAERAGRRRLSIPTDPASHGHSTDTHGNARRSRGDREVQHHRDAVPG
jgi:alkylation response protein AidB-like acyl-CoA dehydrogenase